MKFNPSKKNYIIEDVMALRRKLGIATFMGNMYAWNADYSKMKEDMIYEENKPSFEELINNLNDLSIFSWL